MAVAEPAVIDGTDTDVTNVESGCNFIFLKIIYFRLGCQPSY